MKWSSIIFYLLVLICLATIYVGLNYYFQQFKGDFSNDQTVWGAFGDYANTLINLVNMILLFYIGFLTLRTTQRFNDIQLTPQLILSTEESEMVENADSWFLTNAYDAPAMNILIRIKLKRNKENFTKWTYCFSLSKDSNKEILWIKFPDIIEVQWADLTETYFYQVTYMDWVGRTKKISKKKYESSLNEAKMNSRNTLTTLNNAMKGLIAKTETDHFITTLYRDFLIEREMITKPIESVTQ